MQIRILSIGDMCAVASHRCLAKIAKCDGVEITAGIMSIPDADLSVHAKALTEDAAVYTFDYCADGSVRLNTEENCTFSYILSLYDWDYITVNQCISMSGLNDTYFPYINEIFGLLSEKCPHASVIIVEPWAFSQGCNADDFKIYNNDTEYMANQIRSSCIAAIENTSVNIVFPVGEVWQKVRAAYPELELTIDGVRSNRMGDFISGALWYEILTGNNISRNSYRLPFVNSEKVDRLRSVVHEVSEKYSLHK